MDANEVEAQGAIGRTVLPPDGAIVEVSPWRRQLGWIVAAVFLSIDAVILINAIKIASLAAAGLGLFAIALAVFAVRMPLSGLTLSNEGIQLRSAWWTYRWRWEEVGRFELRDRGNIPRLRIHLRNGKVQKARGFTARKPTEEERCRALFDALEERRQREQARLR